MEPKSGWRWFTLRQFAEKYGFEYAYIHHHRETGELKVKYLHRDDKGIAFPADHEPCTNDLPSLYTVVLWEEAERFANEHRGTPIKRSSKPHATSRKDALGKIILQMVESFLKENNRKPTSNEVLNRLKKLAKDRMHPVIQEVKGNTILWLRTNGKEEKTTFTALQKRLSGINKGQKTFPAND